jgi:hypothetical protein
MKALRIPSGDADRPRWLENVRIESDSSYNERWLQELLFDNPEILLLDEIDPNLVEIVPICRELPLPKEATTVYLDILAATPHGRLILIECKLWRNPQARREVIGQLLEYAALLQGWSYGDLTARLKSKLGWKGENPLFDRVRNSHPTLDEARFVDEASRCLRRGNFDLIVAGDGIRSDIQTIATYLHGHTGLTSRITLVEFQVWHDTSGETIVIPKVPMRTKVIEQRVIVDRDGVPIQIDTDSEDKIEDEVEKITDPDRVAKRANNRQFWQRFIDNLVLDHPDQPRPRHGVNNTVRLDLPRPVKWLTVYRSQNGAVGLFFNLDANDENAVEVFDQLKEQAETLSQETGLNLDFSTPLGVGAHASMLVEQETEPQQMEWLMKATNTFVNTFRPRLAALDRQRPQETL